MFAMMISTTDAKKDEVKHLPDSGTKQDSTEAVKQTVKAENNASSGDTIDRKASNPQVAIPTDDDLILKLPTRNAIIQHLVSIPNYLFGPPFSEEAKERLFKESGDLMMNIASLPLSKEHDNKSSEQVDQKLLLQITWDFKSKLVACLTDNLSSAAFYRNSLSTEFKAKLIEKNDEIIHHLLNWPIRAGKDGLIRKRSLEDKEENRTVADDQSAKRPKLEEKLDQINKIIDEIYVHRSVATFEFELKNAGRILESGTSHTMDSSFYCRGIEWTLMLDFRTDAKQTKFLSIYLCAQDNQPSNWQIKCNYEIKILNQMGKEGLAKKQTAIFKSPKFSRDSTWGVVEFVELKELTDPSKGLLKNDLIVFEVNLKADRMVICDQPVP